MPQRTKNKPKSSKGFWKRVEKVLPEDYAVVEIESPCQRKVYKGYRIGKVWYYSDSGVQDRLVDFVVERWKIID